MIKNSFTLLTADDLGRAEKFYSETLGLEKIESPEGVVSFKTGEGTSVAIYEKKGTERPEIAYLSFYVTGIEEMVSDLKSKGVSFEEYDMPDLKTVDSIATYGPLKNAWFKDSEGNLLSLIQIG